MKKLYNFRLKLKSSGLILGFLFLALSISGAFNKASATSQWAKKYKTGCTTCHTAFPRLNNYGMRFMMNGYQDPDSDTPDGGKLGKKMVNTYLSIDNLNNFLGVRLNFTPLRAQTNARTINGVKETKYSIGITNWVQFFVAGALSKNVSIFIEMEFEQAHFKFSWFKFGIHNLAESTLLNFEVGNISPVDYASYSNRLRQIGSLKGDIFRIKSSGGATTNQPEDKTDVSGSRPGLQYYGYKGPVVVWAGVSPGSVSTDPNNKMHGWAGIKLVIPEEMESKFEGTALTGWIYKGQDASNSSTNQLINSFFRYSIQTNIRYDDFDLQAAYINTSEDNYYLTTTPIEENYNGFALIAGKYLVPDKVYLAVGYDKISYNNPILNNSKKRNFITGSLSYFIQENIRLGLHTKFDVTSEDFGHVRSNDFQLNVRTMF
ncbi:MAG: hypothetical protein IIB83_00705 [Bacteroidetes bacterium]|nr:hypothetical protein [Bacteroidota bacterium]MCH8170258.1 hypothetical protein [Bacteroidota bacterium]MCH8325076.1 hypothetical protein [Bacteroidota bacterium]